jgi:hypothetical protein
MHIPIPGRRGDEDASDLMKPPMRIDREADSSYTPLQNTMLWLEISEIRAILRLRCSVEPGFA